MTKLALEKVPKPAETKEEKKEEAPATPKKEEAPAE